MLRWTLERAGRIVSRGRVVTIVAEKHRSLWGDLLRDQPAANVVVQPSNRGTAAGILLPLLRVHQRDPQATVSVLPSDHYVRHEDVLRRSIARALDLAERSLRVVLLGMTPEGADPDYGWIVPGREEPGGARRVARFVEKPGPALAAELYRQGASWSSFMLAAKASLLLSLFQRLAPRTFSLMTRAVWEGGSDPKALEEAYASLDSLDFSHDLLERMAPRLRLLEVPPCGWTDLGTPARLAQWVGEPAAVGLAKALSPVTAGIA